MINKLYEEEKEVLHHVQRSAKLSNIVFNYFYMYIYKNIYIFCSNNIRGGIIHNMNTLYKKHCIQRLIILHVVIFIAYNVWIS